MHAGKDQDHDRQVQWIAGAHGDVDSRGEQRHRVRDSQCDRRPTGDGEDCRSQTGEYQGEHEGQRDKVAESDRPDR